MGPERLWWRLVERIGLRAGFATEPVDDLPGALEHARLYLVGDGPRPWSAAMLCPCGCGATIQLSLIARDNPSWHATRHLSGAVSLHPSVWRTRGCRSHFHLRRGHIVWSRSAGTSSVANHGVPPMSALDYPGRIERLAAGALAQLGDYFSLDIENPHDVAMLEDRALGTAAKLAYLNTIRNQLRLIASGKQRPADGLHHLDALARAWTETGGELRDLSRKGAAMAFALADRWRNWALGGPLARERLGFVDHFHLPH